MIRLLGRCAAAFLASLAFATPAGATTYSTDFTDLWFNPAESGWGVNVIQQYNTIFATLFVYDTTTAPHWYVAPDVEPISPTNQTTFTGLLYTTTGPFFGATTFNPNLVTKNVVGTVTFNFTSSTTGTLQYVINGAPVNKEIIRQSWRNNVLTGAYLGGLTAQGTNCGNGVGNGPILIFDTLDVTQSATQATMTVKFTANNGQASQCVFTGPYTQAGKLGSITGSWSCTLGTTTGNSGSFTMSSIEANTNGFTARFHGTDQFCTYDGQFGGVRDVPL